MSLGLLALFTFGSNLSTSVLANIDLETTLSSKVIRFAFLIVLACHIPYVFFSGKESLLIIVDEYRNKSMSYKLETQLQ